MADASPDPSAPPAKKARSTASRANQKAKRAQSLKSIRLITPQVQFCCKRALMVSATDNMRWVLTGGTDGIVRKYDFFGSLNGKQPLAPQKNAPFETTKGGVLLSEWNTSHGRKATKGAQMLTDGTRTSGVTSIALEPEAVWCITGHKQGQMHLWTVRTDEGTKHFTFEGHDKCVSDIKTLNDHQSCVSASWDCSMIHWDLNKGVKSAVLSGHSSAVTSLATHATGSYILSGSIDGCVKLWDLRAPRIQRVLQSPSTKASSWIMSVCWSTDMTTCYCGKKDGTVEEWDVALAQLKRTFTLTNDTCASLRALPNGKHVMVGTKDCVLVYDIAGDSERQDVRDLRAPLMTVTGHRGIVSSILVDSGMQYMVTTSGTKGWHISPADNNMVFHTISAVA